VPSATGDRSRSEARGELNIVWKIEGKSQLQLRQAKVQRKDVGRKEVVKTL
jgi:hypothetical protein